MVFMLMMFLVFMLLALVLVMFLPMFFASDEALCHFAGRFGRCKAKQGEHDEENDRQPHFRYLVCITEFELKLVVGMVVGFCY